MPPYKDKRRWRFRGVFRGKDYSGSSPKGDNTKKAAEHLEQELLRKLREREYTGEMPTVAAFVEKFLAYQRTHTAILTQEAQSIHLTMHVVPYIGTKQLDDITRAHIDSLKTKWHEGGAGPRTVNTRLGTLKTMFTLAVEWEYLTKLPKMKRVKVPKDTPRFFTFDEAHAVIEAADPQWRTMIVVGLRTGLRIGELRGLQWGDVDIDRAVIQVRRTDPGRPDVPANAPKGKKERTVPLTADAINALRSVRPDKPAARDWVWPSLLWRGKRKGGPRSASGCFTGIRAAIEGAGIIEEPGDETAWHTLRHTFASWLVMRGTSMRVVQDLLGHSSSKQTDRYAHLAPNAVHHDAVASLDFAIAEPPSQRALKAPSDLDGSASDGD